MNITVNVEISPQLIAMFNSSNEPWGIKIIIDGKSCHIYTNKANYDLLNIPDKFDFSGKSDEEIPHPSAEFSDTFQNHDKKIIKEKQNIKSIDIYPYGRNSILTPYICEKYPFYYKNKCIGVIYNSKEIRHYSPSVFLNLKSSHSYTTHISNTLFTKKEMQVIFFVLQKFAAKEIAKILNLSHRTIENKLQSIYQKANVSCLRQFIEYCHLHGINKYIPETLIHQGSTLI